MAYYSVDIYTPSKVVIKGLEANELIIPTERGEIDVLPEHTHVVTKIGTGVLTAKTAEGEKHFAMSHGIVKVLKDKVTILATTSEPSVLIDLDRAKAAQEKAQSMLEGGKALTDVEVTKYQRKLSRSQVRVKLALLETSKAGSALR